VSGDINSTGSGTIGIIKDFQYSDSSSTIFIQGTLNLTGTDLANIQEVNVQIGASDSYFYAINIGDGNNGTEAEFYQDVYVYNLTVNAGSFLTIDSAVGLFVGEPITGDGTLELAGNDFQEINVQIGEGGEGGEFGNINISNTNINGITFKKDIYADSINDIVVSGGAVITFAKGDSQIIDAVIGDDTEISDYFGNILIRSSTPVTFNQDVFVDNLNIYYDSSYVVGEDSSGTDATMNVSGDIDSTDGGGNSVGIIKEATDVIPLLFVLLILIAPNFSVLSTPI
jgi:hypothetical protein